MISGDNNPLNSKTSDSDFTSEHYRQLCQLAIRNYSTASYLKVPWGERFVLWRHDMDYSLNRGLSLAKIEHEYGLKATYFLNLHSEFYNLAESGQHKIVKQILCLGHDIGLHFDASFFGDISEAELNHAIAREADFLKCLFNVQPVAFSFHNPVASTLNFESDTYGGLLNCYSRRFKIEVPYTSDSNGYWRYRRLHDVLRDATDPCLQVLTHPGWWQDKAMPPRQRIFRSTAGRAENVMLSYEVGLQHHGRLNHKGHADCLIILKDSQPKRFQLCEYLWSKDEFQALFIELWRVHEAQINRLCKAQLRKEWAVPAHEVNAFFSSEGLCFDGWKLFSAVFNESWVNAASVDGDEYHFWHRVRNQIIHSRSAISPAELEKGCVAICNYIDCLARWGNRQTIAYGGLAHLGLLGLPTVVTADGSLTEILDDVKDNIQGFPEKRWAVFKEKLSELQTSQDAKHFCL